MNLIKNMVNLVKETAEEALHTTPLEKALYNSTSNLSVIPSVSDMELVADHTNYYEDAKTIIKYIGKKLKRDNNKRVILRTLDLTDYLVKNGAMRIVYEIRDEKYQIKSLRNMLGADDESEYIELSRLRSIVTKKCNGILELLGDEKKLDEEREIASQTKNRYKGTGNTGGGFGGGSGSYGGHGKYGGESYDGVGSDGNKRGATGGEKRDREKERRNEGGYSAGGGGNKYDPHTGSNNLFKKLGIQEKKEETAAPKKPEDDEEIDFPEEPVQKKPQPATLQAAPQKAGSKFLPPPPSKSGGTVTAGGSSKVSAPPAQTQDAGLLDLGFEEFVSPAPVKPVAPQPPAQSADLNLLDFDLTGGSSTGGQSKPQNGFGNMGMGGHTQTTGGFGQGMPSMGNNQGFGGSTGGMGSMGNNFNGGMGTNFGFGAQNTMGTNFGMTGTTSMGMGGNFGGQQPQTQQPKKLITFDNKGGMGADDFGGFQEAKAKDPSLKNYTNEEADLIDLSGLTSAKKNSSPSNNHIGINMGGW